MFFAQKNASAPIWCTGTFWLITVWYYPSGVLACQLWWHNIELLCRLLDICEGNPGPPDTHVMPLLCIGNSLYISTSWIIHQCLGGITQFWMIKVWVNIYIYIYVIVLNDQVWVSFCMLLSLFFIWKSFYFLVVANPSHLDNWWAIGIEN